MVGRTVAEDVALSPDAVERALVNVAAPVAD